MNKKLAISLAVLVTVLLVVIYADQNNARKTLPQGLAPSPPGTITTIKPETPGSALGTYPDQPVSSVSSSAMSIKYLIDHRSALDGKTVMVKGFVVGNWADARNCPNPDLVELLCPQPFVFLSDSTDTNRHPYYDLQVRLNESDPGYLIGQTVTIRGVVEGSKEGVMFIKLY
ncbi:MAG: hypothetical protein HY397_00585 [Candidatus Doudnabacteria bacterium]|nr:hypothetical protein [Candidatus Doudnabacteria bacterium]